MLKYFCFNLLRFVDPDKLYIATLVLNVSFLLGIFCILFAYYGLSSSVDIARLIEERIGWFASVTCILWNLSPNLILPLIVTQGSEVALHHLSLITVIMNNISSALNCIYGKLKNDDFITLSNLLGGITNFISLLAINLAPSPYSSYDINKNIKDDDEETGHLIESSYSSSVSVSSTSSSRDNKIDINDNWFDSPKTYKAN